MTDRPRSPQEEFDHGRRWGQLKPLVITNPISSSPSRVEEEFMQAPLNMNVNDELDKAWRTKPLEDGDLQLRQNIAYAAQIPVHMLFGRPEDEWLDLRVEDMETYYAHVERMSRPFIEIGVQVHRKFEYMLAAFYMRAYRRIKRSRRPKFARRDV